MKKIMFLLLLTSCSPSLSEKDKKALEEIFVNSCLKIQERSLKDLKNKYKDESLNLILEDDKISSLSPCKKIKVN